MAFGEPKAPIVVKAVEQPQTAAISSSFLQSHPDATFLLDEAAAGELTVYRRPWEVTTVDWTPDRIRQAVVWLSLTVQKALLNLSDLDFRDHHLYDLLREHGPAESLGWQIFQDRSATVQHYPAGTEPTTVLVFSPHPDDDVISMGGTISRLVEQGHRVHIAYMTSGNIAVFDHDAWRFTDFVAEFNRLFGIDPVHTDKLKERVQDFLRGKAPGQPDCEELLNIKKLIRATEARAAALACGIVPEQLEFMDLRFYRTGTFAKAPIYPQD